MHNSNHILASKVFISPFPFFLEGRVGVLRFRSIEVQEISGPAWVSCGKLPAARNYSFQNGYRDVIVVSVAYLLGFLAIFSVYVGYVHCKYTHIPAPKRDSFFLGHAPVITRELESGKIMDELHRIHGCVVLIWLYHEPLVFLSDPELVRKCPVTLNLPKNPFSSEVLASRLDKEWLKMGWSR